MQGNPYAPCDEGVIKAQPACTASRSHRKGYALAATVLGSSMAFIDGSVVNIALPAIQRDFAVGAGANLAAMQWVISAYLLALGSLLLVGGSLGDRYGRRTIFLIGIAIFTTASAACGLAPGTPLLIAMRALQGVGASLLVPASLAIIGSVFEGEARGKAIGTWAAWTAITGAGGPVLGGWLVDAVSWRAIFFLNVPLALATVWLAIYAVPDSRDPDAPQHFDWLGVLLVASGLGALTYGLTLVPERGWRQPSVLWPLLFGLAALATFALAQARERSPMVPPALFRSRDFVGINLLTCCFTLRWAACCFSCPLC